MASIGVDMNGTSYSQSESPWKTPAFIKLSDLPDKMDPYQVCMAIEDSIGKYNLDTVQMVRNTYRIYLLNNTAKAQLCAKGITIDNKSVSVFNNNPFVSGFNEITGAEIPVIRLLIKDLYRSVANGPLEHLLTQKFGLKLSSDIKFSYYRNARRELTNIKTGDRFCFVTQEQLQGNPLPREAMCGRFKIRIFHDGQMAGIRECYRCFSTEHYGSKCSSEKCCRICKNPGHEPGTPECEYYEQNVDILAFGGEDDPFSSLFPCKFTVRHVDFHCSEQAFWYHKCMICMDPDLAKKILDAKDGKHVKRLSKQLRCTPDWDQSDIAINLMKEICIEKFKGTRSGLKALFAPLSQNLCSSLKYYH